MTVPADHIVAATGELENASQVLTDEQRRRLREAETAERPVLIVTPEEALANEAEGTDETKTWRFSAKNVRDFAWSSSRKYIWDAKGYRQEGAEQELVLAMSFWPKEGGDLWAKYSTESVIHTLEVYSRFSFDYPYPTAPIRQYRLCRRHGISDDYLQWPAHDAAGGRQPHLHTC